MKIALDTNILAYAEGVDGEQKRIKALGIVRRLPVERLIIPTQVLGELYNVLTRKAGRPREVARGAVLEWTQGFSAAPTDFDTFSSAMDLASNHRLAIWDAVILAASGLAGARVLLSEDMQSGFSWGGVTVVNPFAAPPHPLLNAALREG